MSQIIQFESTGEAEEAVRSGNIRRAIGTSLAKHYPGRRWLVDIHIRGGVAKIYLPDISTQYAYEMHIHNRTMMEIEKKAVEAGGQILEMFRLSRAKDASGGENQIQKLANGEAVNAKTGF